MKGVFGNVNLSNLKNVLQRNLRTDRAGEGIFRASGGTNFENFPAQQQPWWRFCGFSVCTSLPKKTLDTSLSDFQCIQRDLPHRQPLVALVATQNLNMDGPKTKI